MSIAIPLADLSAEKAKMISKYLTVTSIEKGGGYNKNPNAPPVRSFVQKKVVEAYCLSDNHKIIYMPFSYVYYHFSSLFDKSIIQSSSKNLDESIKFEGSLLERQKNIRDEAFEILNRCRSILLCLHTGFGKTIFTVYLLSKIKKHTIILCHRKIIIDQWLSAIQKYIPEANVGIWSAKMTLKDQPDILIANAASLSKWPRERYLQYGLVVADEIHTMCTEQMMKAFPLLSPQYMIGLSATPHRSDGMDRLLELYIGPEMIIREMKKLFNVYRLLTGFTPFVEKQFDGTPDWNSALESQALSESRNELIVQLVQFFCTRTILVLVKRVDHARILLEMLQSVGEDADVFLGSSKECNYNSRILIATYSKGGVGFDHPKLDMLLGAADVEENYAQYLGRVFRKDSTTPIVVDLVDNLATMVKHSATRMKICKEAGGSLRHFETCFKDFKGYCVKRRL